MTVRIFQGNICRRFTMRLLLPQLQLSPAPLWQLLKQVHYIIAGILKFKFSIPQTLLTPRALAQRAGTSEKQRRALFTSEMSSASTAAKALMESASSLQLTFLSATNGEHVRSMFRVLWTPFLATFSLALQNSDDASIVALSLDGIRYAIRIACIFHLEVRAAHSLALRLSKQIMV